LALHTSESGIAYHQQARVEHKRQNIAEARKLYRAAIDFKTKNGADAQSIQISQDALNSLL
jgi:hypothetical protein